MREIGLTPLRGDLRIMPSKSASHRALLCAALAEGESIIEPLQRSQDVLATLACIEGMGLGKVESLVPLPDTDDFVRCHLSGGQYGASKGEKARSAPCGESGSTLRFLMPLALDGGPRVRFTGKGRLMQRPLDIYRRLFAEQGVLWEDEPDAITLQGRLRAGQFEVPGDVSSQFISGLLLALPRLDGESIIRLTGEVESRGYIELTLAALARCGIEAHWQDARTLRVPGGQRAKPSQYAVEGDWSHAAFYLVAGLIGGPVRLAGLDARSAQGDRGVVEVLRAMGGDIAQEGGAWIARPSALCGASIDASQIPDLVPALAVAACAAEGETVIYNAARLRIKECDRLAALRRELGALGADITERPDGLIIHGGRALRCGTVDSHNDHRIAMALAIAAPLCTHPLLLTGDEAAYKSAPAFWQEYASLGGETHARTMG